MLANTFSGIPDFLPRFLSALDAFAGEDVMWYSPFNESIVQGIIISRRSPDLLIQD